MEVRIDKKNKSNNYSVETRVLKNKKIKNTKRIERHIHFYVKILWTTLATLVSVACTYSFTKPHWIFNENADICLGMYSFCVQRSGNRFFDYGKIFNSNANVPKISYSDYERKKRLSANKRFEYRFFKRQGIHYKTYNSEGRYENNYGDTGSMVCHFYGGDFHLKNLPGNSWQVACVVFGCGCVLISFTAILAIVASSFVKSSISRRFVKYIAALQLFAILLLTSGLLILPFGFNSNVVRRFCIDSDTYKLGSCVIGWPYVLSSVVTVLSMFCPFLSQYINSEDNQVRANQVTAL